MKLFQSTPLRTVFSLTDDFHGMIPSDWCLMSKTLCIPGIFIMPIKTRARHAFDRALVLIVCPFHFSVGHPESQVKTRFLRSFGCDWSRVIYHHSVKKVGVVSRKQGSVLNKWRRYEDIICQNMTSQVLEPIGTIVGALVHSAHRFQPISAHIFFFWLYVAFFTRNFSFPPDNISHISCPPVNQYIDI